MNRILSTKVKLQGFSRNKIVLMLVILGVCVVFALLFGVFDNSNNDSKTNLVENNFINNTSNAEINRVLHNVEQAKLKAVTVDNSSAPIITPQKVAASRSVALAADVPPIVNTDSDILHKRDMQARDQFDIKQAANKYNSIISKTLVYSNPPTGNTLVANTNSSNPVVANALDGHNSQSGNSYTNPGDGNPESKNQFMDNAASHNTTYLAVKLEAPRSPYAVKAGSVIPATMLNGLNSDLPGQIVAQVRQNVYDSVARQYILIPQGAKLVGLYDSNITYGQERILVAWNRLIYPDGSSINLKAMPGTDLAGYAGFHDQVDNHYWKIFGMSFIIGVLTGAMQYSQNNTNSNVQIGGFNITNSNPSVSQTLAGSLGQQLGQTGLQIAQKNLHVQPTLIIRPNYPFNIMLTADLILKPYARVGS